VSGAKLRDFHLAKALAEMGELTYVHYSEPGLAPVNMPFAKRIVSLPRSRGYTPAKVLRGLTGRWPLPIVNYTDRAMVNRLLELVRAEKFDLVHVDIIHMAGCEAAIRPALGATPVMYNWHNIESELMARFAASDASLAKRWYARQTSRRMAQVEDSILESADGHVVCSEREREQLARRNPRARIAVVENGVDTGAFVPRTNRERKRILLVGAMSYHANAEAAAWFAREIWPKIREKNPGFRFTIVGSNPLPQVLALRNLPDVEVTGTVPDVAPWYAEAFAAIVPLRVGSGTRLKILEAMAAGVPVISTKLGAEGLAVTPGKEILLVDSDGDWMAALAKLRDSGAWAAQTSAARELVCARYDWQAIGRSLIATYQAWLS